jgi:hypothetical protein
MPPVRVVWYDGGLMPETPTELEPGRTMGDQYGGAIYVGDKGRIITGSHGANGLRIIPETKMKEYRRPPKSLPRSIGHHQEWVAACKGGAPAGSNFPDYSAPLTEVVLLGNVALRMPGRRLLWDGERMQFTNAPEANQYLTRDYRKGWSL